ncbi:MAG: phosphotransferase [Leptolyngbyaceae cyanobacterium SL_7_1]|nr:phosphotransferase [Leptolyngbyaceae cyanobacterium SM1_4_3]NJN88203.1 phosphotransferase [Leptolyngbyaceae cyanobacterium SL_7_1]
MHKGEIDIDTTIVKRLLAEQFPHLAERSITVVRSPGTVNAIYRLGRDLYVRLPRVEASAEGINREWTWLPKLAPQISLTIPQPLAQGKPTSWYPCPWTIHRWIAGSPYRDDLISNERQAARDLANFILAADVIAAWSVFNQVGRETFRQALDVDDDIWSRARGYALHQALLIIPYYPETNPEFVTLAQRTVKQVLTDFI